MARTLGRSYGEIAGDDALRKADGAAVSRQRVEQTERAARRKLGLTASVAAIILAAERAARSVDLMDRGRRVRLTDLRTVAAPA
jgi:hypothetical protein